MANHLVNENSRYLQQHAGNPVDWYPWGEAAFAKARAEDKLIFLSIGYSACHWCHVMAHESFEDAETAAFLNEHFVSIKVDREERPDLDRIYMSAVQAISGNGGWPMSVFITPEGEPVYGGTYFPKEARYGMPSFMLILSAIAEAWQDKRGELLEGGQQVVAAIKQNQASGSPKSVEELTMETIEQAYSNVKQRFDSTHGGWGTAPKFPQPMILEFLLRYYHTVGDERSLEMVLQTLESMARGGIYDQLGGGFHRYSVDRHWLVPHFEKMLYDNALLARVYLHAYQITGQAFFRTIVEETLDYVAREMTGPAGGFYATQDADTEGEEGRFFLWTPDEVRVALNGPATRFLDLYGITDGGNFEGRTILTFSGSFEERDALRGAWRLLFQAREQRVAPGRDEKVLTSWNGLMLAAFAEASWVLQRSDYRQVAEKAADFLLRELRDGAGRLWHVWNKGQMKVSGLLEDYAGLITGLLALYQATFAPRWYSAAQELANTMIAHFSAPNGFYDTASDAESLVIRPQEIYDNAVPSGNSLAVTALLELARLSGETHYEDIARQALGGMQVQMRQQPLGFGQWLVSLDSALSIPTEIAIVGEPLAEDTCALLSVVQSGYHPHQLLAVGTGAIPPLLEHREQIARKATAHVCVNHVCRAPVNTLQELRTVLG